MVFVMLVFILRHLDRYLYLLITFCNKMRVLDMFFTLFVRPNNKSVILLSRPKLGFLPIAEKTRTFRSVFFDKNIMLPIAWAEQEALPPNLLMIFIYEILHNHHLLFQVNSDCICSILLLFIDHLGINLRRSHVSMSKHLAHSIDVGTTGQL